MKPKNVLITGAAGEIGSVLGDRLRGRYDRLTLADIVPRGGRTGDQDWSHIDVTKPETLEPAFQGVDAVIHLATAPLDADWATMQRVNTEGTWNVFEAARICGVRRVVYTSSNHVTGYYSRRVRVDPTSAIRPDSHYAVTKAYGEAAARMFSEKFGLSIVVLRIGSFQERPRNQRMLSTWLSHDDAVQLFTMAVEAAALKFELVYGVSANTRSFWQPDNSTIGYRPRDNAEEFATRIAAQMHPDDEPERERLYQGGDFCGD